jgi:outer membrane protein assembly factor BamB
MIWSARSSTMRTRVITPIAILTLAGCGATERVTRPDDKKPTPPGRTASGRTSSGRTLGRRWVSPGPSDPQAVAADELGAVAIGRYGEIVALDRRGREQWAATVAGDGEQTFGPVALGRDLAVVPVTPARVVAVDRATGESRWSVAMQDPAVVDVSPDSESAVAVLSFGGVLEVLGGQDGTAQWSTRLAFGERGAPVSVGVRSNRVVAAWADVGGSHVQVFDLVSGQEQWTTVAPRFAGAPAVTPESVVVSENLEAEGRHMTARVRRLDLVTGAEEWTRRLDGPFLPEHRAAVDEGLVVVVDFAGTLTALDLETGSVRWRHPTRRKQFAAAPVLVGDVIAMTTYGTGLLAVDAADGSDVRNDAPGSVQTAVSFEGAVAGGRWLYLLAGRSQGQGEVWMLSTGS